MPFSFFFSYPRCIFICVPSPPSALPYLISSLRFLLTTTSAPAFIYFDQPPSFYLTIEESNRNWFGAVE